MKLLLISTLYPTKDHPDYGTYVKHIHEAYLEEGVDVSLLAFMREGGKLKKGLEMLRFKGALKGALERADAYDVINVQFPYFAAPIIRKYLYHLKTPIITSVHGSDVFFNSKSKAHTKEDVEILLSNSTLVVTPSEFFKEKLLKHYLLNPDQVVSCPPGGFDASLYSGKREKSTRLEMSVVGRMVKEKGVPTLLEALVLLRDELPEYRLRLIGSGKDLDLIKKDIEEKGLRDSVEVLGALKPEELPAIYESTDLFIFPTELEESLGLVGIEAMAGGAFVIGSNIGGIPEYLEDKKEGFLFTPGDEESLAEKMRDYLSLSEEEKEDYLNRAKKKVQYYEKGEVAKRLHSLLERAIREAAQ